MRKRRVNGEKLRDLREDLWLSQGELAEQSKVALHTINRIENGRTPYPQSATLLRIADALELDDAHVLLEGYVEEDNGVGSFDTPEELSSAPQEEGGEGRRKRDRAQNLHADELGLVAEATNDALDGAT